MTSINTNVSDYTLSELMTIIDIDDLTPEDIIENTNHFIKKYKTKNPQLSVFFREIQSQLLQYYQNQEDDEDNEEDNEEDDDESNAKITVEGYTNMINDSIFPSGDKQVSDWYKNEVLEQSDKNQSDKITDRKQKIKLFGNEQVPMNREQIATTDTFNLPVKQDSLNPNLKNTITRFLNLDSQFRQYTSGPESQSTNYTMSSQS